MHFGVSTDDLTVCGVREGKVVCFRLCVCVCVCMCAKGLPLYF